MDRLKALAVEVGDALVSRNETIAVAESSTGGLVSAALLAAPGASRFFVGGGVIYAARARGALLGLTPGDLAGTRPATEPYALNLSAAARRQLGTTWGLAETGAAGPTGNRYGDPAGHSSFAVTGPVDRTGAIETGVDDRWANMLAFAETALTLCLETIRDR